MARRNGKYRLARLAEKYGAEIGMEELLVRLTVDCAASAKAKHPYQRRCAARLLDLDPPRRPPDAPATVMRLVASRKG